MNPLFGPTFARINLNALSHNLQVIRGLISPQQSVLAVVKADAYGHGAVPVARHLAAEGIRHFGVARVEEGVELRQAGIEGMILVFGGAYPGQEPALINHQLTPTLFDLEAAERINAAAVDAGQILPYHLKVDTGMSRIGFLPADLPDVFERLDAFKGLQLEGVLSHFALADDPSSDTTQQQADCFWQAVDHIHQLGRKPAEIHISNSAGIVTAPSPQCTLVRPGISLYGSAPSEDLKPHIDLRPVMSFETQIARLQELPPGTGVSYGHRFVTERTTRLASLPVGYADGFHRGLSHQIDVLIRGQRAPVVGTICMDWALVDVTDLPEVAVGDPVILLGADGQESIRAEEWARRLQTISYEIYCHVGKRVPRLYEIDGEIRPINAAVDD